MISCQINKSKTFITCKKYTLFYTLLLVALVFSPDAIAQQNKNTKSSKTISQKSNLSFKIIDSEQNTFGYEIYNNNQKMIYQPTIPGLPGNKGFKRKTDAEKVAKLVIAKINRNEMPPTVTKKEMLRLKVKL